jgi:hypothetical protein
VPDVKKPVGFVTYGDSTIVTPISEGGQLDWVSAF